MNILILPLRGNVIGDSIREIALAKKLRKEYKVDHIYYPTGKVVFNLLKHNRIIDRPLYIRELDMLNRKDISKIKKLFFVLKAIFRIYRQTRKKNIGLVVYTGKKYFIRKILARALALLLNAKFKKKGFEEAIGYNVELEFTKKEEKKIKKYLRGNKRKNIAICVEATEEKRRWNIENYKRLINYLLDKDYNVYLLGIDRKYNKVLINEYKNRIIDVVGKLDIREVISHEGLYSDIASRGEYVVVRGKLEEVYDNRSGDFYHVIHVGSYEMRGQDFIKPIRWQP